ncbi:MAG: DUF4031 domain-containing protein [Patescibacteria group bacterium]|jgi:hypothetical protein
MICVDDLTKVLSVSGSWKWPTSCHLFSDTDNTAELHRFAEKIGLKRQWFQNHDHGVLPHYDLNAAKRDMAVQYGASEVSMRYMVEVMQKNRGKKCL